MIFQGFPRPIPDSGVIGQIKSIQNGTVTSTFGVAGNTFTQAISSVDVSKSVVIVNVGLMTGLAAATNSLFNASITSATQITITRNTSNTDNVTLSWQVIEFSAIKSMQSGTFNTVATDQNTPVAISAVNTSKSIIFFSFSSTNASTSSSPSHVFAALSFTSSTSMNFLQQNSASTGVKSVKWYVVELY